MYLTFALSEHALGLSMIATNVRARFQSMTWSVFASRTAMMSLPFDGIAAVASRIPPIAMHPTPSAFRLLLLTLRTIAT